MVDAARTTSVHAMGAPTAMQDKVNFTVAIIPMAQELGWSSTVSGLVQSFFFWGFFFAQVRPYNASRGAAAAAAAHWA